MKVFQFRKFNSESDSPLNQKVGFEGHDDTWLAHQDDFQVSLHDDHNNHDDLYDHDDHDDRDKK